MKRGLVAVLFSIFLLALSNKLIAQPSDIISNVTLSDAVSGQAVEIKAELYRPTDVSSIYVYFRNFGQSEFIRRTMEISGTNAIGLIPSEYITPPSVEYYFLITTTQGEVKNYPPGSPDEIPPARFEVKSEVETSSDILILSPAQNEMVASEELLISISFIRASPEIDRKATKVYLGNLDITEHCLFADDLIIFSGKNFPEVISNDDQLLKIEIYDEDGNLKDTILRSFKTVRQSYLSAAKNQFVYNLDFKGEARNESYNEEATWYNNLDARFKGSYSGWNFDAKVYATSEEKAYRQPQNRYSASVSSEWLNLKIGDSYPVYPEMIMSGKRLRGVDLGLNAGFFSLQASYGQVNRSIEGALLQTYAANEVVFGSDIIEIDETKYGQPFGRVDLGEYSRDILAIRPSFRAGNLFEIGLTFLKGGDDKNSIDFGSRPQENIVLGTDLKLNFDNNRIQIGGDAAISFLNSDISTGTLTDTQIDSVFGGNGIIDIDPDVVKNFKSLFGSFMEINQFFGPWNPDELASLASEASIGLNYFDNNLKFRYIYRGNDYTSFGQSYLRTDVKGINIVDRIRLLENKVFLSVGFESLEDNLQDTKIATTTFQTINSSVSVYPGTDIPNITFGFTRYDNSNELDIIDSSAVDNYTNKFYAQFSHDFIFEIPHSAYLYFSTSNRTDNSVWNRNAENFSVTLNLRSNWNEKISSHFGGTYYSSESASLPYDYSSFFIGGTILLLENKLELRATLSPSFGDFERQAFDFTGSYKVIENLVLSLQARFYRIPDVSTNSIVGLITRYTL
ncbi:MAG: hypothetical protein U5K00_12920 [Melioribacteraceae bacterium]|nr:hypothetical protein [Melioribacteraceae bacterium]